MKSKMLALFLAAVLTVTLCPGLVPGAAAETTPYDISLGNITINTDGDYEITGTTTTNQVVVSSGVSANITLNNVSIDVSAINDACAFNMAGATVNLTLVGENTLKSGNTRAGLWVPRGAALTINGEGSLDVIGGYFGAGIGGGGYDGNASHSGNVTISGGTVIATGGDSCAGIGGGYVGNGGTITISGGAVTATGGNGGAGIGGGHYGGDGTLTITGGSVKITNNEYALSFPKPKNAGGADICLAALTVGESPVVNTAITGGSVGSTGYGLTDVQTDGGGKVYFYLPAATYKISLDAGGRTYTNSVLAVTSSGATETLRLEAESLADPTSSPSPSSDPTNPTDTNQAVTVPSDTNGAFIDLTAETITLPEGFTVEAYSINGGGKWKKGSLPASAKFTKLFNKELTLWVTDSFDTKAKSPTAEVKAVAATESARLWRPKTPPK